MSGEPALSGPDLKLGVPAAAIAEGKALLGHADGEAVMLTRCDGAIVGVGARCPHYGGPLNEGLIVGDTVRCPWHHAAFSLRTGAMLRPPALGDLPCWSVEERGELVVVTGKRTSDSAASDATRQHPGAPDSIVILGGGAAGAFAANTLRREGYDGAVTIIEAGPSGPYDRPNLSKDYLAGTASEDWIPLHPDAHYAEHGIELLLGKRAVSIDPAARTLRLDDGTTRSFGALLIATGASPVKLDFTDPGQPVHYLRSLGDSRAIIEAAGHARRAVVIGASFIGLEVAASLRTRGLDVTVVGPEARPLERVLGPEMGDFVRSLHEEHGVAFRLEQTVARVDSDSVTLTSGERLEAQLVVAGIGVRPETGLAEQAGIATDRGILVNEYLETNVPGIYAAGDNARWPDVRTGEQVRVEHWVVAQRQGQTAARNMIAGSGGERERFDAVPFFWSQHYDVAISYVGHAARWDSLHIDGDIAGRDCELIYREGGHVRAVATIFRDRESLAAELALERRSWHAEGSRPRHPAMVNA